MNDRSQTIRAPKRFELPDDAVTTGHLSDGSVLLHPRHEFDALLAALAPLEPEDVLEAVPDLDI